MRIYVCIKQVPNVSDIKIDVKNGCLIRSNCDNIINPSDKNALEFALKIKDKHKDVEVYVITMGPMQAMDAIYEAIAMGVDKGVLLSDRCFAGADTYITSNNISRAIYYLGMPDLVLVGKQAQDGETAQVGPQLAEKLKIDFESSVNNIIYNSKKVLINKIDDESSKDIEISLPCLLTVCKNSNNPRNLNAYNIANLDESKIIILTHNDLNLNEKECGLDASLTKVVDTYLLNKTSNCNFITEDASQKFIDIIRKI